MTYSVRGRASRLHAFLPLFITLDCWKRVSYVTVSHRGYAFLYVSLVLLPRVGASLAARFDSAYNHHSTLSELSMDKVWFCRVLFGCQITPHVSFTPVLFLLKAVCHQGS